MESKSRSFGRKSSSRMFSKAIEDIANADKEKKIKSILKNGTSSSSPMPETSTESSQLETETSPTNHRSSLSVSADESFDSGISSAVFQTPLSAKSLHMRTPSSTLITKDSLQKGISSPELLSPFSEVTSQTAKLNFCSPLLNSIYATSFMGSSSYLDSSPCGIKPPVSRKEYEETHESVDPSVLAAINDSDSDEGSWDSTAICSKRIQTPVNTNKKVATPKRKRNGDCDEPYSKRIHTPDTTKSLSAKSYNTSSSISSQVQRKSDSLIFDRRRLSLNSPQNYSVRSTTDRTPYSCGSDRKKDPFRRYSSTGLPFYNADELQNLSCDVGFIDTHCHLDFLFRRCGHMGSYANFRARQEYFPKNYEGCVAVFCDPLTFKQTKLWKPLIEEDSVWAAFGCHPHNADEYDQIIDYDLTQALKHPKVRALGEIGLDYSSRNNANRAKQHSVFRRQLKLAKDLKLPLVIHCREAHQDCLDIMQEMVPTDHSIHLHCFTDNWTNAQKWLDAFPRLFIGITNVVTFPSATTVHEVVRNLPLNRLLLETDSPYFVPRPLGKSLKTSHPGMAVHVAAQIAAIKGDVTLERVLKTVRANTKSMYGI